MTSIDRRELLKKLGAGSLAVAAGSALGQLSAAAATAESITAVRRLNFHFTVASADGQRDGIVDAVILAGDGLIMGTTATGNGTFQHFDAASSVPQTVLAAGAW